MCPLAYGTPHPWCLSPTLTQNHVFAHPFSLGVCRRHLWGTCWTWLFLQQLQKCGLSSPRDDEVFVPSPSWCWSHPLSSCHVPASLHISVNCTDGEIVSWCELLPFPIHDWRMSAIRESSKFQKSVLCWFVTHLAAASSPPFHMSLLK